MGLLGTKPFCVPHFFDYKKLPSFSLHDPEFQQADSSSCSLGKGGDARKGRNKQSRETIMQPWGKVLVPHQWIHTTISLSCFADTETPSRWEKLTMVWCPQACRPQSSWNLKVDDADSYLPHHQPIRRMSTSWSRPSWTITIKLPTILSKWGHSFSRQEPTVSPFAWQSNKAILFYFTQNSVSKIQFHTRVQRSWAFDIRAKMPGFKFWCFYLSRSTY